MSSNVSELRDALAECDGGEINPSNYGHDDVCNLNERYCATFQVAERAIEALATLSPPASPQGVEQLREALQRMVYETTHLSPCEVDGSHRCIISSEALKQARAALSHPLSGDPI